jgi:Na+-driven multidrug efflux pump
MTIDVPLDAPPVSGRSRLTLNFSAFTFQRDMFIDILKVGAVSCLSPLQSVLTILIFTKILAGFGTETLAGDPGVISAANSYFAWAGPAFGFFGAGVCLYFASQGAAKVGGPVLASTVRLLMVAIGGWWLALSDAPAWTLYALVGAAMVVFGVSTAASIRLTRWGK